MIYIILVVSAVIIATAVIINARADRELERRAAWFASAMMPHEKFSLAEYYEQIEHVQTELLQEREREPKREIVLWWGLDGCKIDGDGNIVWISKRKEKGEDKQTNENNAAYVPYSVPIPRYPTYNLETFFAYSPYCPQFIPSYAPVVSGINTANATNIAQQIQALETEQYKLRLQAAKAAQNAWIIENIKSLQEQTR